jgi:signal transduction histidine kinase
LFRSALLNAESEASPDGILVVDEKGKILSFNHRFAEMWRIPKHILADRSDERALQFAINQLVRPEEFLEKVRWLYAHPNEKIMDELALTDDRTFERFSSPISGPGGRLYGRVWFFRDITARARAVRELQAKTEELARSNADLEVYAYAASHDLTAPLRRVIGLSEALRRRMTGRLNEEDHDLLARIIHSGANMAKLVEDILHLSSVGRERVPPEIVDLSDVVSEVKTELQDLLAESRGIVDLGPLPALTAHRILLRSLFQNLLSNALKFRREDERPHITISSKTREDGGVVIAVADNGIGFEQDYSEDLFKPFFRLHSASDFPGSGLGLTISRRIVERYGGTIDAQGVPEVGTTITIFFPKSALAGPAGPSPSGSQTPGRRSGT